MEVRSVPGKGCVLLRLRSQYSVEHLLACDRLCAGFMLGNYRLSEIMSYQP